MRIPALLFLASLVALQAHGATSEVDGARIEAAASDPANWLTTGRTHFEELGAGWSGSVACVTASMPSPVV
jgi:hypothetical protein